MLIRWQGGVDERRHLTAGRGIGARWSYSDPPQSSSSKLERNSCESVILHRVRIRETPTILSDMDIIVILTCIPRPLSPDPSLCSGSMANLYVLWMIRADCIACRHSQAARLLIVLISFLVPCPRTNRHTRNRELMGIDSKHGTLA